jgi:hypothetical protein
MDEPSRPVSLVARWLGATSGGVLDIVSDADVFSGASTCLLDVQSLLRVLERRISVTTAGRPGQLLWASLSAAVAAAAGLSSLFDGTLNNLLPPDVRMAVQVTDSAATCMVAALRACEVPLPGQVQDFLKTYEDDSDSDDSDDCDNDDGDNDHYNGGGNELSRHAAVKRAADNSGHATQSSVPRRGGWQMTVAMVAKWAGAVVRVVEVADALAMAGTCVAHCRALAVLPAPVRRAGLEVAKAADAIVSPELRDHVFLWPQVLRYVRFWVRALWWWWWERRRLGRR